MKYMNETLISLIHLLTFLLIVISFYLLTIYIYNIFISFFGFKQSKRDYALIEDDTRFLILVAAHNEERVIRSTIKNLKSIDYNKFDICIVSDRSTDKTTNIALEENVKVVDTILFKYEREGVGKPAGLQYALRDLGFDNVKNNYDMILVLDADNFVDTNILSELNSQFLAKEKPEVIQCYLDSKNYNKMMSLAYSMVFWTNNKFSQLSRYRLGLINSIGGTGFAVRSDYLVDSGGFNYKSLTEDLEMEVEITKKRGRILWNDFASIYDEKPQRLNISMKQRHRWAKGHFYVAFKEFFPLLWMSVRYMDIKCLDKLIFLLTMGRSIHFILMSITVLLTGTLLFIENKIFDIWIAATPSTTLTFLNDYFIFISIVNIVLLSYSFLFLPLLATYMKIKNIRFIRNFFAFLYFIITDFIVQTWAIFTWPKQNVWYKTPHIQNEIKEIDEEVIIEE